MKKCPNGGGGWEGGRRVLGERLGYRSPFGPVGSESFVLDLLVGAGVVGVVLGILALLG